MKLVLCGLGRMGQNHARLVADMKDVTVVGVVDADLKRAGEHAARFGCPSFAELAACLDATKPDAVVIAASTSAHGALAKESVGRGIATFVEKPLARTGVEGRAICELAEKTGAFLMVGHVERFNPAVVAARRLVMQGALGDVVNVSTRRVGGSPADKAAAGDVLVDLAVHDIDLVHFLTGQAPRLLSCAGHTQGGVDSATLLLQAGSAVADVHCNWLTPVKIREVTVTGAEGYLSIALITQKVVLTRKNKILLEDAPLTSFYFDDYLKSFAEPDQTTIGIHATEPLKEELKAFFHSVQARTPSPVPPRDALLALEIAESARQQLEAPGA
jgi:UDP-N-acetylglucosamine 3-dehydrogenase